MRVENLNSPKHTKLQHNITTTYLRVLMLRCIMTTMWTTQWLVRWPPLRRIANSTILLRWDLNNLKPNSSNFDLSERSMCVMVPEQLTPNSSHLHKFPPPANSLETTPVSPSPSLENSKFLVGKG